jgi:hypothetical protein
MIRRMPTLRAQALLAALTTAASLACAAPALAGEAAVGVEAGASPDLVRFDTAAPGTLVARVPISGLMAGETVAAIDVRPATGELWAITSGNRVVKIDVETGVAQQPGPPIDTVLFTPNQATGFDFNPAVDRLRLVGADDDNLRYNPLTFTPVDSDADPGNGTTPDSPLAYIATDPNFGADPSVVAGAYTNNDNDGLTATTLFGIDSALDVLVRQGAVDGNAGDVAGGGSPNGGLLTTIGPLTVDVADGAFDTVRGTAPGSNAAFAALRGAAGPSTLYAVNLTLGGVASAGVIAGTPLAGFALMPGGAARATTLSTAASEATASARVTIQRSGNSLAPVSIGYRTADRTAAAGQDYTAVSGTLEFAQGVRSRDVVIPLRQDTTLEGPEALSLLLGPTAGGVALDTREHTIGLLDDERSTISITSAPDRTKPAFLIAPALPDHLRALGKARRLRLDFACSERCVVELTLKLGRKRLGGALATLDRPGVKRATVRLTKAGRKAVARAVKARKRGRVALKLSGVATDAAGNSARRTATLRLARR